MKKAKSMMAAIAVAAMIPGSVLTVPATAADTGISPKYNDYVKIDDSHFIRNYTGNLKNASECFGIFVHKDIYTKDGTITLTRSFRQNDMLLIGTPDGVTDDQLTDAIKELGEKYADLECVDAKEKGIVGYDYILSAQVICSTAAKEIVGCLEGKGYIAAAELQNDFYTEFPELIEYPLRYYAASEERDELCERLSSKFPEYTVTAEYDSYVAVSYEAAVNVDDKLTVADKIYEQENILPVIGKLDIVYGKVTVADAYSYTDGDANCDGKITVSDAVAVLQYIANAEKYPLSAQGAFNADADGEEGITGGDAVVIQRLDAGIWDE